MSTKLPNPVKITRVEMAKQKEKIVINLYTTGKEFAKYPVLQLFSNNFWMLIGAGIDPNELKVGSVIYCDITAHWRVSMDSKGNPRINSKGNPRINPTKLERTSSKERETSVILSEIHAMLAHIIDNPNSELSSAAVIAKIGAKPPALETMAAGTKIIVKGKRGETPAILESASGAMFAAIVNGKPYNLKRERFVRVVG